MPFSQAHPPNRRAFTLVEILVALAIVGLVGTAVLEIMRQSAIMAAKSTSIATTENESRKILTKLRRQLFNAVSVPTLLEADFSSVSEPTPSASTEGVGGMGISFYIRPLGEVVPADEFNIASGRFDRVAYMQRGNRLEFYPDYDGPSDPGDAVLLSTSMVPPTVTTAEPGYHMPFRYILDLNSEPLQFSRDAIELNLRFIPSESGRRLGSLSSQGEQNFNNFFQMKTIVWLRNGGLL